MTFDSSPLYRTLQAEILASTLPAGLYSALKDRSRHQTRLKRKIADVPLDPDWAVWSSFDKEAGIKSPEMVYLDNHLTVEHAASGLRIKFDTRDALRLCGSFGLEAKRSVPSAPDAPSISFAPSAASAASDSSASAAPAAATSSQSATASSETEDSADSKAVASTDSAATPPAATAPVGLKAGVLPGVSPAFLKKEPVQVRMARHWTSAQ